jgi:hypothetical protein
MVSSTGSNPEDEYADDEYADYDAEGSRAALGAGRDSRRRARR